VAFEAVAADETTSVGASLGPFSVAVDVDAAGWDSDESGEVVVETAAGEASVELVAQPDSAKHIPSATDMPRTLMIFPIC